MEEKIFKIYFPVSFSTTNDVLYELFCCFDMHIAGSHFIDLVLFFLISVFANIFDQPQLLVFPTLYFCFFCMYFLILDTFNIFVPSIYYRSTLL